MKAMGFRCAPKEFSWAVVSGTRDAPLVEQTKRVVLPKNYSEAEWLKWVRQEAYEAIQIIKPDRVALRSAEPMAKRTGAMDERVRREAAIMIAAAHLGHTEVRQKVGATMSKDLGMKGKAKYLKEKLDTSPILNFESYREAEREAILVAWSCLE